MHSHLILFDCYQDLRNFSSLYDDPDAPHNGQAPKPKPNAARNLSGLAYYNASSVSGLQNTGNMPAYDASFLNSTCPNASWCSRANLCDSVSRARTTCNASSPTNG